MANSISKLTIQGFKSIRSLNDFELRPLNILIGPNGAGKSNFVAFFRMLREMVEQQLQLFIQKNGGADAHLYLGPKVTKQIVGKVFSGEKGYEFVLEATTDNRFVFQKESVHFAATTLLCEGSPLFASLGSGHDEALLRLKISGEVGDTALMRRGRLLTGGLGMDNAAAGFVYRAIAGNVAYHFHDTSETAGVKRRASIRDNEYLRHDASNLAAFLFRLQKEAPKSYADIRDTVRLVAPFFDDFKLRPAVEGSDEIELEWTQMKSDYPFHASQLSDGTLRFMCLATALLQPHPPSTVLLDEPELGMHPYGLTLLASLLKRAAQRTQVVVSTQSAPLLNPFEPEDIVVVERQNGESIFKRLDRQAIDEWLKEYSLGDLWQKNVIGGRPTHG